METKKHILAFAVEMGFALLENGSEIYRAEDTMEYIVHAHGIYDCNIYVQSSGIFVSAGELTEDHVSFVRNVKRNTVNLARLIRLNQISRNFCKHRISLNEAWEDLEEAKQIPVYGWKTSCFAAGIGCAGFTYIIGGSIPDCVAAYFISCLIWFCVLWAGRHGGTALMTNYLGSLAITGISMLLSPLSPSLHQPMIIAGGIMLFVPGVLLATAIREFLSENFITGTSHLLNSILISAEIVAGVGTMYAIRRFIESRF